MPDVRLIGGPLDGHPIDAAAVGGDDYWAPDGSCYERRPVEAEGPHPCIRGLRLLVCREAWVHEDLDDHGAPAAALRHQPVVLAALVADLNEITTDTGRVGDDSPTALWARSAWARATT